MSSPIVKAGVVLGVLVALWTFLMGITGWGLNPALQNLFFAVILFQVLVMIWGLRQTAAQGRTYGGQIVAGLGMSLVASVLIFSCSYLFSTVVFPHYLADLGAMTERSLQQRGVSAAEIKTMMDASAPMRTPLAQAVFGVIGTMVTGLATSLVAAFWIRKK